MSDLTGPMANTTLISDSNAAYMVNGFDGGFIGFQTYFEGINGPHPVPHLIVSGDLVGFCPFGTGPPGCYLGSKWTPNDPLFFLHHAMVGKLWGDWQRRIPTNKYAFGGGSAPAVDNPTTFQEFPTGMHPYLTVPGDGLWDGVSVWDVVDTQAGPLYYVYP